MLPLDTGSLADLCQLDNGGCEQVCYNLCNLKVQCGCWPGYTLAYDGKTCIGEWQSAETLSLSTFVADENLFKRKRSQKNLKKRPFYFKYLSCLFPRMFVFLYFVLLSDGTTDITIFSAQYVVKQSSHNSLKAVGNQGFLTCCTNNRFLIFIQTKMNVKLTMAAAITHAACASILQEVFTAHVIWVMKLKRTVNSSVKVSNGGKWEKTR